MERRNSAGKLRRDGARQAIMASMRSCGLVSVAENVADHRFAAHLLGDAERETHLAPVARAMAAPRRLFPP